MKFLLAVLAVLACALTGCGSIRAAQNVSPSYLLANPQAFEGKRVRLEGFVSYGFENCMVANSIWYWPKEQSCYDLSSHLNAWQGRGAVIGTVSLANHGHLGAFSFSVVNATVEHW